MASILLHALLYFALYALGSFLAWFLYLLSYPLAHMRLVQQRHDWQQVRDALEQDRLYRVLKFLAFDIALTVWLAPLRWGVAYHRWFQEQRVIQRIRAQGWVTREARDAQGERVIECHASEQAMREFDAQAESEG